MFTNASNASGWAPSQPAGGSLFGSVPTRGFAGGSLFAAGGGSLFSTTAPSGGGGGLFGTGAAGGGGGMFSTAAGGSLFSTGGASGRGLFNPVPGRGGALQPTRGGLFAGQGKSLLFASPGAPKVAAGGVTAAKPIKMWVNQPHTGTTSPSKRREKKRTAGMDMMGAPSRSFTSVSSKSKFSDDFAHLRLLLKSADETPQKAPFAALTTIRLILPAQEED